MAEARRAFLALWPPAALAAELIQQASDLPGRPLKLEDVHLTLAFLGTLDEGQVASVCDIARRQFCPASTLRPDRIDWWAHPRVIWAGVEAWPDTLARFHAALREDLLGAGFELDARAFAPHLTLARQAAQPGQTLPRPLHSIPPWQVEGFCLAASAPEGSDGRYIILQRWPAV